MSAASLGILGRSRAASARSAKARKGREETRRETETKGSSSCPQSCEGRATLVTNPPNNCAQLEKTSAPCAPPDGATQSGQGSKGKAWDRVKPTELPGKAEITELPVKRWTQDTVHRGQCQRGLASTHRNAGLPGDSGGESTERGVAPPNCWGISCIA